MPLAAHQIEEIRKGAEAHTAAATDMNRGTATLWNSQLNMALAAGDEEAVANLIRRGLSSVAGGDNNCGCARASQPMARSLPQ